MSPLSPHLVRKAYGEVYDGVIGMVQFPPPPTQHAYAILLSDVTFMFGIARVLKTPRWVSQLLTCTITIEHRESICHYPLSEWTVVMAYYYYTTTNSSSTTTTTSLCMMCVHMCIYVHLYLATPPPLQAATHQSLINDDSSVVVVLVVVAVSLSCLSIYPCGLTSPSSLPWLGGVWQLTCYCVVYPVSNLETVSPRLEGVRMSIYA